MPGVGILGGNGVSLRHRNDGMNRQYEYEQDKRPGGPAYESRELEDEMTYWDKMVESINQQTKEIKAFGKWW